MVTDIFEFWSEMGRGAHVHPRDRDVIKRLDEDTRKELNLDCLPASFWGRLRTAPVVLLYHSPGWSPVDSKVANSEETKDRYVKRWTGNQDLPGEESTGWNWWTSRTKSFGKPEEVRSKVAFLNVGAYHSQKEASSRILASLPSTRVTLDWAQNILFPQAIAGECVVVCMRAAKFWGLGTQQGKRFGKALYVPEVNRGGFMQEGDRRRQIEDAIKSKMRSGATRPLR